MNYMSKKKNAESKDVFIQFNPSYGVSRAQEKITEDQYGKVELKKFTQYPPSFFTEDAIVKMENNSSYGLSGNATDIIMTSNPFYSVGAKSSIKEKSSDYVHTDML